jgi:hypothetical protein
MKPISFWCCLGVALIACGGSSDGGTRSKDRPKNDKDASAAIDAAADAGATGCAKQSCDPNASCDKASGKCKCDDGYTGDGESCADVDECAKDNGGCDPNADCVNSDGGFSCKCQPGKVCAAVDECANPSMNDCADNATCVDTKAAYDCTCAAPFAGDDPKSCYCDLSGYWAMRQDVDTCWCDRKPSNITIVSGGSMEATVWELHKYTYDGNIIKVEKKGCGSDNSPDLISPFFGMGKGETYSSHVPNEVFDRLDLTPGADIPQAGIVPGAKFTTPNEAAVVGIDLGDDPLNAPWPTLGTMVNKLGGKAPAWADTESDGAPGLTVWPLVPTQKTDDSVPGAVHYYSYLPLNFEMSTTEVTERAGCVSLATRIITKQNIDVDTCEHLVGDVVNVNTEGRVEGCTTVPMADWNKGLTCEAADWKSATSCDANAVQALDTQQQTQTSTAKFELVKIGGLSDDVTCADVRKMLPAITRTKPTPVTCDCP